ncbi:hypothetical protein Pcinc_026272 [Petrolisthes cinctipes]|uniref:Uncharacterized protein n=1 Tax=Petrolisthes cinctipes TaxID=88211 RepID=A0AAE1KCJ3_PETCI|nr:hypothetical protein Pcinc_026272 [Petrolisthes cinctipes]
MRPILTSAEACSNKRLQVNSRIDVVWDGGNVTESRVVLTPRPGDHGVPLLCKAFSPPLPGTVLHHQLSLAVHFVPVARLTADGEESQVQVREGGSVTFTCRVKANPTAYKRHLVP